MLGWSVILATLFLGKPPRGMLPVFMMVGPVLVQMIYRQLQDDRNRPDLKYMEPWHFISSLPFHGNSVVYIDTILNDILIFDVIKSKAPDFVGHSKSGCQYFNASKFLSCFNVSLFYYT